MQIHTYIRLFIVTFCLLSASLNGAENSRLPHELPAPVDMNPSDEATEQNTALFIAAGKGNLEAARYALGHGANPNFALPSNDHSFVATFTPAINASTNVENMTPLMAASRNGNAALVRLLLDHGASHNACHPHGWTPLFFAADNNRQEALRILLHAGANVNKRDTMGQTPLFLAVINNYQTVIRILLHAGANVNQCDIQGRTPLFFAIINNYRKVTNILLHAGANVNKRNVKGRTPLFFTVINNHQEATRILLHAGANVNKCDNEGLTPLIKAATQNATETIPLLIAAGAQINYKQPTTGLTALSFAASFNNTAQIVELLLNANATVDNIDLAQKTPLILACIKNHHDGCKKIIQKLLEHGANIEASDKQGVTPFIAAGWAKNYLALYTLKASGANINHQNILGSTALINAIFESDDTTAQVLINLGVDLNVCNLFGGTALIVAVLKENIYIIQKLLSAYPLNNPKAVAIDYCPRNTTTKKTYNTALIMAIKNKNDVIIKLLLEHGANPTKRNGMGQTPLDIINQSPEELGHLRPLIENAIAEWQPR